MNVAECLLESVYCYILLVEVFGFPLGPWATLSSLRVLDLAVLGMGSISWSEP